MTKPAHILTMEDVKANLDVSRANYEDAYAEAQKSYKIAQAAYKIYQAAEEAYNEMVEEPVDDSAEEPEEPAPFIERRHQK